ncbi:MAG: biopolymer transporter ExbD [Burkholderiaceae bacterium]
MAFGGFDNQGGSAPMADINTTPLVDVMLVLLVIFIITAPLMTHSIKLDLPAAQAPATDEKPETITLSIDGQNHLYWNNEPVADIAALAARFQGESGKQPQPELHLRADKESRYQTIAEVMSAAQQAGLTKIGFITDPKAQAQP